MAELNPDIAAVVVEACQANADEAAGALGRALGGSFTLKVGEAGSFDAGATPAGFDGSGLMLLFRVGDVGMAVALPAASGLVPDWCAAPDATGESKLATLAQELSMLLAPESIEFGEFKARRLDNLTDAIARAMVAAGAAMVAIELTSGEKSGQLSLIWPLEAPAELLAVTAAGPAGSSTTAKTPLGRELGAERQAVGKAPKAPRAPEPTAVPRGLESLPKYSQSLLKIQVPVSVRLAAKKEPVQEVITLAPGSIIKFEKGCDELLQMIVGEHTIAEGEAVKIGDKFGFRVTSMLMPREHFVPVKKPRRA
ncbi:MAG: FliM/FliN family flagellar motor switch protein [Pirellulales bacterium]|nr:FliM/FliN family flagellar motor switch protein [Pirellulales bacterium]